MYWFIFYLSAWKYIIHCFSYHVAQVHQQVFVLCTFYSLCNETISREMCYKLSSLINLCCQIWECFKAVILKLDLFLLRLDEISGSASKEFGLEKAMEKMKVEWKDMYFELIPYRDTVSSDDVFFKVVASSSCCSFIVAIVIIDDPHLLPSLISSP